MIPGAESASCYAMKVRWLALVAGVAMTVGMASPAAAGEPVAARGAIKVCLQPLGSYDRRLLGVAARGIEHVYGLPVATLAPRALPGAAWYAPRKRWRADKLLEFLSREVVPGSGCAIVIGFTRHDVSTTKGKHVDWGVLGLGEIDGDAAMVSSHRMRGTGRTNRMKRAVKVVNHELGHVLGLPHYRGSRKGCLMSDAEGTVKTVDAETGLLCPESIAAIEQHNKIRIPRRRAVDWKQVLR